MCDPGIGAGQRRAIQTAGVPVRPVERVGAVIDVEIVCADVIARAPTGRTAGCEPAVEEVEKIEEVRAAGCVEVGIAREPIVEEIEQIEEIDVC